MSRSSLVSTCWKAPNTSNPHNIVDVGMERLRTKVSVIIPTYCRPDALSDLLDSLENQSVKPFEVIVIDDTPDPSVKLVCESHEPSFYRLKVTLNYVKNVRERSSAIARNVGAKIAHGDFFMFFDDDVVLYPDYIERVLETYDKYPEVLAVSGWFARPQIFAGDTGRLLPIFHNTFRKLFFLWHWGRDSSKYMEYPLILTRVIKCKWANGNNLTVKRSVFCELQFDEKLKDYAYMEDFLFSALIHKKYPNGLIGTPRARCIHKHDPKGRMADSSARIRRSMQNRKYVLWKLLGSKGLLVFGWQNFGILIFAFIARLGKQDTVIAA